MGNRFAEAFPVEDTNLGGLTKREYAAIHILAGLVGSELREGAMTEIAKETRDYAVKLSVLLADKLFDQL